MGLKVYNGVEDWDTFSVVPILTVGSFDGVHKAHQQIINLLNLEAEKLGGESVLLSFDPHPRAVIDHADYGRNFRLLTSLSEKRILLGKMGLKHMLLLPFDQRLQDCSAEDFIKYYMVEKLRVKKVIIGYNHFFGKDKSGNFDFLSRMGKQYGFEVEQFPEYMIENEHISSTSIRCFISGGDIAAANRLLGYEYSLMGAISNGEFTGEEPLKLLPSQGTYLVKVITQDEHHNTLCKIDKAIVLEDFKALNCENVKLKFIKQI